MLKSLILVNLAIISIIVLLGAKSINAAAAIHHITDPKQNYTISGNDVILHSLIGDIKIPIPAYARAEYRNDKSTKLGSRRVPRQVFQPNPYINYYTGVFPDFFECNEQAQIALSAYSDNHRYWEAFFKRNSINNTLAVRYCCNLLEYVDNAEISLSPDCRDQVRLQDHVMVKPQIRYVCREYEFYNIQCFLVRWMYWWIPFLLLILIGVGIFFGCSAMQRRRNKSQLNDEIKSLKETKYDDHNSNTLPYRPPYISPLKQPATNKAFLQH